MLCKEMELVIKKDAEELSRSLAQWMVATISEALKTQPIFSLVLSGGSTPKKLYDMLSAEPLRGQVDWNKVEFYWGDERCVPFSDPGNNARMAFDHLLSKLPVVPERVHIIDTEKSPAAAAEDYEKLLDEKFPAGGPGFDLVLLGLGDNAHTLSLFPGYELVRERKHRVRSFYLGEQKMHRVTLTAPAVNAAKAVLFMVSGADKATALQQVLEGPRDPDRYPAQAIHPVNGKLYWWVDEAAAKKLTK